MTTAVESIADVLDQIHGEGTVVDSDGKTREVGLTAMRREQGEKLQEWTRELGASRTIETGFAFGSSGLHMVQGMLEAGCERPHHVAMDPFQERSWGNAGIESFRRAGVREFLTMYEESSALRLPAMIRDEVEPFDLAFVDGAHLFENAFIDIYFFSRLVRPGGLLIVDDIWMPGVRWAMDYFVKNLGWTMDSCDPPLRKQGRWRKHPEFAGVTQVAFRVAGEEPKRAWDHFVAFGDDDGPLNSYFDES